jgi:hypothetical protein
MPTPSEYLNAALSAKDQNGATNFTPYGGLQQFTVNGVALSSDPAELGDGFYASVYQNSSGQLIVAFGPTSLNPFTAYGQGTLADDAAIANNQMPLALQNDITQFMQQVVQTASEQNISASNIFVAGYSLGGTEAEYAMTVAPYGEQIGGGAAFDSTGLPQYNNNGGQFSNFRNYLMYGDPVSNDSSDSPAGQAAGLANQDHLGQVQFFGNQADQQTLTTAEQDWGGLLTNQEAQESLAATLSIGALDFHFSNVITNALENAGLVSNISSDAQQETAQVVPLGSGNDAEIIPTPAD